MATVNLTTSPTQIDDGTSVSVLVTNTGASDVELSRGGRLRPAQSRTVYPEGTALSAAALSGAGQVSTVATAAPPSQAAQVAANTAAIAGLPNTYVPRAMPTAASIFTSPAFLTAPQTCLGVGAGGVVYLGATTGGTTLRRTADNGVTTPSVTIPSGVTNVATCQQIYEWNGYVYAIFQDAGDSAYKLYRAPITSGLTALTWSAALITLTSGSTGFGYTLTGTSQALLVGEYGDPVVTATPTAHIWRSIDGTTFTAVKTYGPTYRHVHCVAADPYNDGQVWASVGDNVGTNYSYSADHGATWTDLSISAVWQGTQISFTPDWVWVAPDAVSNASAFVFDRATKTPRVASWTSHRSLRVREPGTFYNGSTTSGSAVLTTGAPDFASAFTSQDVGRKVYGAGIPAGTTILTFTNGGSVTMSANATATATGVAFTVERPERPFYNCYTGIVDPATGVYYGVALADPSVAPNAMPARRILFAIPYVGGHCIHLADLNGGGTAVRISNGQVWWGQCYVPLIAAPYHQ